MLCDHGKSGTGRPRSVADGEGVGRLVASAGCVAFVPPTAFDGGFIGDDEPVAIGYDVFVECTIAVPFIGVLLFGDAHHRASASGVE
jgi:hypothetical protein